MKSAGRGLCGPAACRGEDPRERFSPLTEAAIRTNHDFRGQVHYLDEIAVPK